MPVLAFTFESPWMLWGLAAAAAPVIIHLLNRRRYREMEWAAMRFLMAAIKKNSRRMQLEQLLLLLLRTAILLFLGLAMARPTWGVLSAMFSRGQPVHRVLVVDASASMALRAGDTTVFARAQETARQIAAAAGPGDAFNLVRLADTGAQLVIANPTYQPDQVIAEIAGMTLSQSTADLSGPFKSIQQLLSAIPQLSRKEVYYISDFQRATWGSDSQETASQLRELIRQAGSKARLACVDVGSAADDTAAVVDFQISEPFVMAGREVGLTATIRDFGTGSLKGRKVELLVDGNAVESKSLQPTSPQGDASERFNYAFPQGGEHTAEVRLAADSFAPDDQRFLAIPVRDQLRVLVVSGRRSSRAGVPATDFLTLALAPEGNTAGPGAVRIEPVVIGQGELQEVDVDKFDCVFVCNVPQITQREADLLDGYVRRGGGLVWCMGDDVRRDQYNGMLVRENGGLLAGKLGDVVGNAVERNTAFEFDPGDYTHPVIKVFEGNPDAGLRSTRTFAYVRTELPANSTARVVLRFDSGDPAIIEQSLGLGHTLLVCTSMDDSWSNWAVWPSFVPMVQEMVAFSVAGRWGDRQRLVGQALRETVRSGAIDIAATVQTPAGDSVVGTMTRDGQISEFSFAETELTGIYTATFGSPVSRSDRFACNLDPRESDPARMSRDELLEGLFSGRDVRFITEYQPETATGEADGVPRDSAGGLSRWFLYAVLYFLLVELAMAWNFAIGAVLLCPPLLFWYWSSLRKRAE